jgi:hypothetical protein
MKSGFPNADFPHYTWSSEEPARHPSSILNDFDFVFRKHRPASSSG